MFRQVALGLRHRATTGTHNRARLRQDSDEPRTLLKGLGKTRRSSRSTASSGLDSTKGVHSRRSRRKLIKKPPRSLPGPAVHRLTRRYDVQLDSLRANLHRTELEVFRERFDKERVVGELLDTKRTLRLERSKRFAMETQMNDIARVVESLYFDSSAPLVGGSETDDFETVDVQNLPEHLRQIRTRVQSLHVYHARDFNTIGDLKRELEEMRESFVERELQWYHERRQPDLQTLLLLQELQLEYGMALWRQRGMELELLSAHRELTALHCRVEAFERVGGGNAAQAAYIQELERRLKDVERSVRETIQILVGPIMKPGGSAEALLEGLREVSGLQGRCSEMTDGTRTSRQQKGESYESTATAVSRTRSSPNPSPRKSVHFKLDDDSDDHSPTPSRSDARGSPVALVE